ncbi:hypothetical protein HOI18_00480 [Candidatus Uhrbacteria bacterium]|jgi:hypothetical protein|nr:hypothetical protein [Candidatus Uhrbacteria bacterium]
MAEEEIIPIEVGQAVIEWEVDEYPHHARSKNWYVIGGVLGVFLIVYAVATANFLFAVIILMIGIITLLSTFLPPDRIPVVITTTGVVVNDMYYDFESINNFSIAYDPPSIKYLYFEFHSAWHPLLSIPLEEIDPNQVRDNLLPFCTENLDRTEETLTDVLRRMYKL